MFASIRNFISRKSLLGNRFEIYCGSGSRTNNNDAAYSDVSRFVFLPSQFRNSVVVPQKVKHCADFVLRTTVHSRHSGQIETLPVELFVSQISSIVFIDTICLITFPMIKTQMPIRSIRIRVAIFQHFNIITPSRLSKAGLGIPESLLRWYPVKEQNPRCRHY